MNQDVIGHLIELRRRLIFILLGFLVVFLCLFHFSNNLYDGLAKPLLTYLPHGTQLIATDVTSPFFVPLKLTAIVAGLLSLPNTVYQIWHFIAPGLYRHEKKLMLITLISVIILFACGMLFCFFIVLPTLFNFIAKIKASDIAMMTDISKYLDLVLSLFIIFGTAFQMPIIIYLLIYFNIVTHTKMADMRKYMLVGAFIIAAIVTPPDILSQTMLAIPLYLLYELGLLMAKLTLSKHQDNQC
jgi:sec-independent protein translocase protein TatC